MDSDKYICVCDKSPQNGIVIIDRSMPMQPLRLPLAPDSAIMNPVSPIVALKAQVPGTTYEHLHIYDIEMEARMKSHLMPAQVEFWKWITPKMLGLVTQTSVYHWSIQGNSEPVMMFNRQTNLSNNQIINYECDPSKKWLMLIGIAPGSPERPLLGKGNMQLYSVDLWRSRAFEAHAASFASFKVRGKEAPSLFICYATNSSNAGQVTSKLHVTELGWGPSLIEKQADFFFPPGFATIFQLECRYLTSMVSNQFLCTYISFYAGGGRSKDELISTFNWWPTKLPIAFNRNDQKGRFNNQ